MYDIGDLLSKGFTDVLEVFRQVFHGLCTFAFDETHTPE
jgi:hypothetical protein